MQRRRNIQLLISLLVLSVSTVVVFFVLQLRGQTAVDKSLFKVADLNVIDRATLKSSIEQIELKLENARWKVNGTPADRTMIDVLFATLQQVEPVRPVAQSLKDSISTILDKQGIIVSLFAGDELQQEFIAGGNPGKTQAYFKTPGEKECYIMAIPGYRVYASGIFELDENGWKDRLVFNFNWRNFQSLKATHPSHQNDFEVSMGKAYYEVKGVATADTTKLNDFLDAVSLLTVDQYVKSETVDGYDSLIKTQPLLDLQISDVSGKTYTLVLYEGGSPQAVLGIIGGVQPAFFDKRKVAGILKSRSWFVKN